MTLPTTTDPVEAPHWIVRAERPLDLDQIHDLHRAAFRGPAEAELVDAIRSSAFFLPDLSMVASTDEGSVLGHVMVSRIELVGDDDASEEPGRIDVLALAPIAVLPQHQDRGIGTALMHAVLAAADDRQEPMTIVLGAPAFYARFGFVPALAHGLRGPYDEGGDAFQVRPRPGAELNGGTVVYPAPFGAV